jgi:N-acetylglutamate synthase-like GNAT family acetyltransferase
MLSDAWSSPRLVCRPALPSDTPAVLALARQIWNGNDYLPNVWSDWLADPCNHQFIAQYGSQLIGTINLKQLGPDQWFLEALRVHPDFQGRGFSNQLFAYVIQDFHERGAGELRLITSSRRLVVHHLCDRWGFKKSGEIRCFTAEPRAGPANAIHPLPAFAAISALASFDRNLLLPKALNLVDLGWEYGRPGKALIAHAINTDLAFTWQEGRGYFMLFYDEYDGLRFPYLSAITCAPADLTNMLIDIRHWTAQMGFSAIAWNVILQPALLPNLAEAGFTGRPDGDLLYLYMKIEVTTQTT